MKTKFLIFSLLVFAVIQLISMSGPYYVHADDEFTLSIFVDPPGGEGGSTTPVPDAYTYLAGTDVFVSQSANAGWRFFGWSGDAALECAEGVVHMDGDKSCTAKFSQDYLLTISIWPPEGGQVTKTPPGDSFQFGEKVSLDPTFNSGWQFDGWEGPNADECEGIITIADHDIECTARFSEILPTADGNDTWMGDISDSIQDRRIMDVVLPGSHDAGTYSLYDGYWTTLTTVDEKWQWINEGDLLGKISFYSVVAGWARTQSGSIQWQLENGSRYLDLRFVMNVDGIPYIYHGEARGPHDHHKIFGDIKTFLNGIGREKEIVILDFSYFQNFEEPEDHQDFLDTLLDELGDEMIPRSYWDASLGEIWAIDTHPRLIVTYDAWALFQSTLTEDEKELFWTYPRIGRPWAETNKTGDLQDSLKTYTNCACYKETSVEKCECTAIAGPGSCTCNSAVEGQDCNFYDSFYIYQGLFTPDETNVRCGVSNMLRRWLKDHVTFCILSPVECGILSAIAIGACPDHLWKDSPVSLKELAVASTSPGGATPKSLNWAEQWWSDCDYRARDNFNILAVDFIEYDNFKVVQLAKDINLGEYNEKPTLDALNDLQGREGFPVILSGGFEDPDLCDYHRASINWGDGTSMGSAEVNRNSGTTSGSISGYHVYADNGIYDVDLCLQEGPNPPPTKPFINEIHYENVGDDTGEGVEVAGAAGTTLTGWNLSFYDSEGGHKNDVPIDGTIPDQYNGYGVLSFPEPDINAGGIALVDDQNQVHQFLCYGAYFGVAQNGPAVGLNCQSIVAGETTFDPGQSLQLSGKGTTYGDYRYNWNSPASSTFGEINDGQVFVPYVYSYSEVCQTLQVDVANVIPTVTASEDQVTFEDEQLNLILANFTDPGFDFDCPDCKPPTAEDFTATVDWGDGQFEPADGITVTEISGSVGVKTIGHVRASHAYDLPGIYVVTITVTDDDGGSNEATFTIYVLNRFMAYCAYANEDHAQFEEGSRLYCSPEDFGGVAGEDKIELKKDSFVDGDVFGRSDVKLEEGSEVTGTVTSGGKVELKKDASAAAVEENAIIPDVTQVQVHVQAGRISKRVPKNGFLLLDPGNFGEITVKEGGTLQLTDGIYHFKSLKVEKQGVVEFLIEDDAWTVINVEQNLEFGEEVQITAPTGSAADILFKIKGNAVKLGKEATLLGTYIAPGAHIDMHEDAVLTGLLYSEMVQVKKNAEVNYAPAIWPFVAEFLQ